jgi:tetratricopeptide (TPR) repeat protein
MLSSRPAEALKLYQKAYTTADDPYWKSFALCHAAELRGRMQEYEEALVAYEEAREIQKHIGDLQGLAISWGGIADILVAQERWTEALPACQEALKYQKQVVDHERLWRTNISLVEIYRHEGDIASAEPYWSAVAERLFGLGFISEIDNTSKRGQIYNLLELFTEWYQEQAQKEKEKQNRLWRIDYGSGLNLNIDERAKASLKDGEALMKLGDYVGALKAFRKACSNLPTSMGLEQASINERMGDLYSKAEHEDSWGFKWAESDKAPYDQAAHCYEIAITEYMSTGEVSSAIRVLRKLFNHLIPEEIGLAYAIRAYLDVLDKIPLDVVEKFADEAVSTLTSLQRWSEAGDLMLDTGNYVARKTRSEKITELEGFYRRAEDLYERGSYVEHAEGLSRLVQGYYRIGYFDEVIRCFVKTLNLYEQADDLARYVSVVKQVRLFSHHLNIHDLDIILMNIQSALNGTSESSMYFWDLHMTASWFLGTIISKMPEQSNMKQNSKTNQEKRLKYGEQAREHLEICMEFAVTNHQRSSALNSDGLMLSNFGALDLAQEKLEHAMGIKKYEGDDLGLAVVEANLASVLRKKGECEAAIDLLQESIDILERYNKFHDYLLSQQERPLTENEVAQIQWGKKTFASTLIELGTFLLQVFGDIRGLRMIERAGKINEEAVRGKVISGYSFTMLMDSVLIGGNDYD